MRYAAAAMFNTVCEAEGAVQDLRAADLQDVTIVAKDVHKREVFVDDLISRNPVLEPASIPNFTITDRMTDEFLAAVHQAGRKPDWYRRWVNDGYVLVAVYVDEDRVEEAGAILENHNGAFYGATHDIKSAFSPEGPIGSSGDMPEEGDWRNRRSA